MFEYEIKYSGRKTFCLEITRDAKVLARVPKAAAPDKIERFVKNHAAWVEKRLEQARLKQTENPPPSDDELRLLKQRANEYIPRRVSELSTLTGLMPASVKITSARTRFGSCSPKNSLCFSCLLMNYPPQSIDYVIIHELAHTVHHNHSKKFWALVESVMPDYKSRQKLLK